jgi:predicted permease
MITVYCGIFFLVQIRATDIESGVTTGQGIFLDENTKLFFFFAIIVSNLTFFIFWFYFMYIEVKSMLIMKFGKVYTYLCLCRESTRLEKLQ